MFTSRAILTILGYIFYVIFKFEGELEQPGQQFGCHVSPMYVSKNSEQSTVKQNTHAY